MFKKIELKDRSDLHLARKIWHMTGVSIIAILYIILPKNLSFIALTAATLIFITADILRHKYQALNEAMVQTFSMFMRESEVNKLAGTTYLLTGVCIVVFLFPQQVVGLTLLFLAFADPIASFFGIKFGKDKLIGNKSLQGFLAAFVVCTILSASYLYFTDFLIDRIIVVSILGGLAGAIAELVPIGKMDDNLTLPVLSALALLGIFSLFGGFTI